MSTSGNVKYTVMRRCYGYYPVTDAKGVYASFDTRVKTIANMPDSFYDKIWQDVCAIRRLGFGVDWYSYSNILIDHRAQAVNHVDLAYYKEPPNQRVTKHEHYDDSVIDQEYTMHDLLARVLGIGSLQFEEMVRDKEDGDPMLPIVFEKYAAAARRNRQRWIASEPEQVLRQIIWSGD